MPISSCPPQLSETTLNDTPAPTAEKPRFNLDTQDVGNIVAFGHVNLRVPDQQQAVAAAIASKALGGSEAQPIKMTLEMPTLQLTVPFEGSITLK